MHLAFQPLQIADPSSPVRWLFGRPNILAQQLLRTSPVATRPRASRGPRAIVEEPESISACPMGQQCSWQAIVRAQPELQFIHQILIICSKASVPGGHPGIVYFCKEWLFQITDEEPEMSWWILSAKFCNLTPPKSVPPLTLFFCVPTSNTTILFYFHHLRYAFEDPKLTFLTFPKLRLNPTGITLHQFLWWINCGPTESHQANPGLPVSLFSPHKAFPHFLREELFFFFSSANPR